MRSDTGKTSHHFLEKNYHTLPLTINELRNNQRLEYHKNITLRQAQHRLIYAPPLLLKGAFYNPIIAPFVRTLVFLIEGLS
jgi:hypothetical protein